MNDSEFIKEILFAVKHILVVIPDNQTQYADEEMRVIYGAINKITDIAFNYNATSKPDTRKTHVGSSNYSNKKIQPWDIWSEYRLNPWDADIVKRILRTKSENNILPAAARILDYQKIQHICAERIDQINGDNPWYKDSD